MDFKEKVQKTLDSLRPALQADGGDVQLINVDEKTGVVKVKLQGACSHCPMSAMTLQEGIGRVLREKVEGFKEIESV